MGASDHAQDPFKFQVGRGIPGPLYRQLAELLRYRIRVGTLSPGDALPTVRKAAALWGIHHHTVRRAYRMLASEGLLESRRGSGTRVLTSPAPASPVHAHLRRFLAETKEVYHIDPEDLIPMLRAMVDGAERAGSGPLWVVECSATLSRDLALIVSRDWGVDARPWRLDDLNSLPAGRVLGTPFHARELEPLTATRELLLARVQPDREALAALLSEQPGEVKQVLLCDREMRSGHNMASDLRELASPHLEVKVAAPRDPATVLRSRASDTLVVFSPGSWDLLSAEERATPGVHRLPVRFSALDEAAVGAFVRQARA